MALKEKGRGYVAGALPALCGFENSIPNRVKLQCFFFSLGFLFLEFRDSFLVVFRVYSDFGWSGGLLCHRRWIENCFYVVFLQDFSYPVRHARDKGHISLAISFGSHHSINLTAISFG